MREFLEWAFGGTEGEIHLSSLDNVRGRTPERHVHSRDLDVLCEWAEAQDADGRGTFFCVSTLRGRRNKGNAVLMPLVHLDVDLKDVDLDEGEILQRLLSLDRPPSRVHSSGNGIHAYWKLRTPASAPQLLEPVLRRVAVALAGDLTVAQCVALMRLVGTHNTKREKKLVQVLHRSDRTYDVEELEEPWPPAISKRAAEPLNPFLAHAQEAGFKPPMDVEARLAAMTFQGEGESAVHQTQLAVAASLAGRGVGEDQIVQQVIEATRRAAGAAGDRWDWRREERAVRGMVKDWIAKHGEAEVPEERDGTSNVVSLRDARAKKEPKPSKKDLHVIIARGMVDELAQKGERVLFVGGYMHHYREGAWRMVPLAETKEWIDWGVERGCRALGLVSKNSLVSETRGYVTRSPDLRMEKVPWDSHGKVAVRSGLLDVETGEVEPHRPDHWTTRVIDCGWQPDARPKWFLRMLGDMFDRDVIDLLQEITGSFLVKDRPREMRRALVLVGGSVTGKSTLISVMGEFFSPTQNATRMEALENAHGLMGFLQPDPWVLHEAFEQGKWHFSATAKSLLSADSIGVNIKNGPLVSHVFKEPILWGTNVPPQFRESTKAMQNRLALVECTRVFEGDPIGAAKEAARHGLPLAKFVLETERDGILAWAVEGWRRLKARGRFDMPASTVEGMHEMWLQSNIVAGFVEDCVEFDPEKMVPTSDFVGAFTAWWGENRGTDRVPSSQAIGMAVKALGDQRIEVLRDRRMRYYSGLLLSESGIDYWQSFAGSRAALDGSVRLSASPSEVNRNIRDNLGLRSAPTATT